jgi:hypothetical protein
MPRVVYVSAANCTVSVSPATIESDGVDATTVTIRVLDDRGEPMQGLAAANIVVACTGSGNTITQPTGTVDRNGYITASIVSTGAAVKTVSATVKGLAVTQTASLTVTGAAAILSDDFSTYADRAALLNAGVGGNPWTSMLQTDVPTPGDFIYLDAAPPTGSTGGKAMRYFFEGVGLGCFQGGGGARWTIPAPDRTRSLWTEVRVYYGAGFTTQNTGCAGAPEYKFLFHFADGGNRSEVMMGSSSWGSAGTRAGVQGGSQFDVPSGQPGEQLPYFIGAWRVLRWMTTLPSTPGGSDAAVKLWVDGTLVINQSGITVAGSNTLHASVSLGSTMNEFPASDQELWWDYARVYNADPGWT